MPHQSTAFRQISPAGLAKCILIVGMLASSNTTLAQNHRKNAKQTRKPPPHTSQKTRRLGLQDKSTRETQTTQTQTTSSKAAGEHSVMPKTAIAYAHLCEPELGVPPKIILDEAVEIPVYRSGEQVYGNFSNCDNPALIGKQTVSGSVLQRYEGRTAEGRKLPHVVWIAFGRN